MTLQVFNIDRAMALDGMSISLRRCASAFVFLLVLCAGGCDEPSGSSSTTDSYVLTAGPISVDGVTKNLSGISYSGHTDTLFAIQNKPIKVVEIDRTGNTIRIIDLDDFDDTEDIVWVGGERFAIIEEGRSALVFVSIGPNTTEIKRSSAEPLLIATDVEDNVGLEGIAYDSANTRFFIVKEKQPQQLYQVLFPNGLTGSYQVSTPWNIGNGLADMIDLTGAYYDSGTGHLWILSNQSSCLVEFSLDGKEITRQSFRAGHAGLSETIPQAEGVSMDANGNLYICSEPNLFYVFSKLSQ